MKRTVILTVKLVVEAQEGFPPLSDEDMSGVLEDMDYQFTPASYHVENGVKFNEFETEIRDWDILGASPD